MRPGSLALSLLGLLLAGAAWSAPRIPAVAAPRDVRVGGEYVTALPGLPAGVEECELLLLPDDGSGRAIRLSPERDAGEGPLAWRMPRVHATRARLVLRAGGRFGETESAPSEFFAIAPAPPREPAEVLRGEDELAWHFEPGGDPRSASLARPGATTIGSAAGAHAAGPRARGFAAEPPGAGRRAHPVSAFPEASAPSAPPCSRRPAFVPLRN